MGALPQSRLLRPGFSSLFQDSGLGRGGGVLAPRGAPRHGWVGQGVFGSLLRASGTSGPGGVRAFSLSPTRVVRPTEKRALSLLRSPWPGQLRRMKGGKVSTVPQKTP